MYEGGKWIVIIFNGERDMYVDFVWIQGKNRERERTRYLRRQKAGQITRVTMMEIDIRTDAAT